MLWFWNTQQNKPQPRSTTCTPANNSHTNADATNSTPGNDHPPIPTRNRHPIHHHLHGNHLMDALIFSACVLAIFIIAIIRDERAKP